MAKADFAWLDALRRRHYPSDRNRVPAHLTLFRSLPSSAESEARRRLARAVIRRAPEALITGVMDMDSGVALRIESEKLQHIRGELAEEFHGMLSAQDRGPWTPHVTIQNKAEPRRARMLLRQMRAGFEPRPLGITGLRLVRYVDGEWETLARWCFR